MFKLPASIHDQTTPVRAPHRFDEAALARYLTEKLEGFRGPMDVRQFSGGQSNPTFLLCTEERAFVLRKQPPGELLPNAHRVDREFRILAALAGSGVPVPATRLLCQDTSVVGKEFFVMEFVAGRVLDDPLLPSLAPAERRAVYEHFAEVLATLHRIDYAALGLADFGRPGNYFARQVSRWSSQYNASRTHDIAEMEALMEWLPANIPAEETAAIVHGDYRLGNCILHPNEPRIVALLDWELSTIGNPLADLGYCCMGYYGKLTRGSFLGADLPALGIPTEEEFVRRYCELTGRNGIAGWKFYVVFSGFRSAAIAQGVYKRGLDGIASSETYEKFAEHARERAGWAWNLARG